MASFKKFIPDSWYPCGIPINLLNALSDIGTFFPSCVWLKNFLKHYVQKQHIKGSALSKLIFRESLPLVFFFCFVSF
jgi:hypothetical protein